MNQTKPKTIEDIIKEFDEGFGQEHKYCCCGREYCSPGDQKREVIDPIKDFIRTQIATLLESLKREGKRYGVNITNVEIAYFNGYNQRNQELDEDINKILGK